MRWGLLATVLVATACGSPSTGSEPRIRVVVGVAPVAEMVQRVGGEGVGVTNITPPGAEPHDIELDPRDVETIARSDLVLYLGDDLQPALADAARNRARRAVDLLDPPGADAHLWLDPVQAVTMLDRIASALSDTDTAGAAGYRARAEGYRNELADLHDTFAAGLASCARRVFITTHDAFGHLAERYRLEQESIGGLSPESEPDPRRLAELTGLVRETGSTTIFTEPLLPARAADALARETGARTAILDPIESFSSPGATYLDAMRANLRALREALSCR